MKVKGIMFSGFAAAILMGAVDASAATAFNIASKAYVDQEVGKLSGENGAITNLTTRMGTAETNISDNANAITNEASARSTADNAITGRLDVIEGEGAGSIKKAEADAKSYADTAASTAKSEAIADAVTKYQTLTNKVNSLDGPFADDTQYPSAKAVKAALTATGGDVSGLATRMDTAESEIDALQESVDTATTGLKDRVTAIENSDAYKSGIDSTKVAQIATNANAISTINGDASTTGSIAKAIADEETRADGKYQTLANKATSLDGTFADDTQYPSAKAVKAAIDGVSSGAGTRLTALENAVNNQTTGLSATNTLANNNADAIAAINNATTGIEAKAATDATTKANAAEAAAKLYADGKFGGGENVKSLPAYTTCSGDSGKCVLSIDKTTGALEWVEVTAPLTSNN